MDTSHHLAAPRTQRSHLARPSEYAAELSCQRVREQGALRWSRLVRAPLMKSPLSHCALLPTPLRRTRSPRRRRAERSAHDGFSHTAAAARSPSATARRSVSSRACIGAGGSTVSGFHGRGSAVSGPAPPLASQLASLLRATMKAALGGAPAACAAGWFRRARGEEGLFRRSGPCGRGRWASAGTGRQAAARRGGRTARRARGAPLSK